MKTKKIITIILAIVLPIAFVFSCGSCVIGLGRSIFDTHPNTMETAEQMTNGEYSGQHLKDDEDYWLYFDLEKKSVVALAYDSEWSTVSYFYDESEANAAPYYVSPDMSDPGDPDHVAEPNRLYGNGFETRELPAGRYYFRLHVRQGGMFGRRRASAMFLIVDDLPALPTGAEHIVASNSNDVLLDDGYYTLDLTEERSDFTAEAFMPEHVSLRLYLYYGENNSREHSFYFYDGRTNESLQTFTLPAGRTIVEVSTMVDKEYGGARPDATVKFTVVKAAPGTVFDREVSALPGLPLGRELKPSEMFDLEPVFNGRICGRVSKKIELFGKSVLYIRLKGYPDASSLDVIGYYNTDPLNSVKRQSGVAVFGAPEHHVDRTLSFELPAGLNLIELRVNLAADYSHEVFAASTIEFNVAPVEK